MKEEEEYQDLQVFFSSIPIFIVLNNSVQKLAVTIDVFIA